MNWNINCHYLQVLAAAVSGFAKPVDGIDLQGHLIENISINVENDEVLLECRVMCLFESTRLSINIGSPAIDGARLCQLSNSDHIRHPDDLKPQEGLRMTFDGILSKKGKIIY